MSAFVQSGAWIALLGWPAVIGAAVALSTAVVRRSRTAAVIGCVLAAPMLLYLSLTPRFDWPAASAFGLLCVFAQNNRGRTEGSM
jgi:glycerol-3-phosphate acyltransferase PlsY